RERRRSRDHFSTGELDEALGWNTRAVEELDNWPEQRWLDHVAAIDSAAEVAGVGGITRVGYSPSAARHLLTSYPEILDCLSAGTPPRFADGPGPPEQQLVRESVYLEPCGLRRYGPFFVASGETLRARIEPGESDTGPGERSDVVSVLVATEPGAQAGPQVCQDSAGAACEVPGPGIFYVDVAAGAEGLDGALVVDYRAPGAPWSACLSGAFPGDAAVIKAEWRRAQFGFTLPVYDTSAAAMAERLAAGASWGEGDGEADPGPEAIYTLQLSSGNIFRLAGLHLMTKELDHWLWITLWWSPEPDSDFGADRPPEIAALGGPWRNYKMCATVAFTEGDSEPGGGFESSAPSLAAALAATHAGAGGPSWCSNPYIEAGAGNAGTNCVGCHQHGGTGTLSEMILADHAEFPALGRTQVRNNFPTDYSWSVDQGENLGLFYANVAAYYDAFESDDDGSDGDAP
ncbi:MAG: hypothetical protein AAGC55_01925, partial [Myxococcota bacterium]